MPVDLTVVDGTAYYDCPICGAGSIDELVTYVLQDSQRRVDASEVLWQRAILIRDAVRELVDSEETVH